MAHCPSALACHASRLSRTFSPVFWTAKSTMVVVPPQAAARVPISKVSEAKVPPKGSSMWVWQSMPPGTTYFPVASMTRSAPDSADTASVEPGWSTAAIVVPSTSTSAAWRPVALTSVPFLMSVVMVPPSGPV